MAFINTIRSVWDNFFAHMQTLTGQSGSGSNIPITEVIDGEATPTQYEAPFVAVQFIDASIVDRTDSAKTWRCRLKTKIVTTVPGQNLGTPETLSKIAQVQDAIDAFPKPAGVTGFEDGEWSPAGSIKPDDGDLITVDSLITFNVVVTRGSN